jgi:hypothetical protein
MGTEWGVTFVEAEGFSNRCAWKWGNHGRMVFGIPDQRYVNVASWTVEWPHSPCRPERPGGSWGHSAPTPTDTPRADCYILAFLFQTGP